jgi:hypothetical protein
MLCRQVPLPAALRFFSLLSGTGSLKEKHHDALYAMLLHSYGYAHIATLHRMQRLGLLRTDARPPPFSVLRTRFNLTGDVGDGAEGSSAHVYYGYSPLLAHVVDHIAADPAFLPTLGTIFSSEENVCSVFSEPGNRVVTKSSPPVAASRDVLVVVLGGLTMSEMAALRVLGARRCIKYHVIVTSMLTSSKFVGVVLD